MIAPLLLLIMLLAAPAEARTVSWKTYAHGVVRCSDGTMCKTYRSGKTYCYRKGRG
jgi:hypothetical protein